MPQIPNSGPISLSDFAAEFGGTAPHSMSEYYRAGANVPSNNSSVPTAGAFRFGQMRGAINAIINTLANTTNVNLATLFGDNWASSVPKEIIIPSGVTIGGTGSSDALTAPSGMGGTLTITNAGNILGFGGAVATAGGNAINIASANITVTNSGLIAGGGGGGGAGGTGGQGGNGSQDAGFDNGEGAINNSCANCSNQAGCSASYISIYYNCTSASCCMGDGVRRTCVFHCHHPRTGGAGGAGGSGGIGQGYNQTNANGSAGGAGSNGAGSAGAGGTGGIGGNGATYGTAGSNGATGSTGANGGISNGVAGSAGASGGAAGAAVIYSVAYTMNNTGTLAGAA